MARYTLPIQAPAFSPLDRRFRDGMPMQPLTALPQTVDLSQWLGPVRDQNIPALGECSAESGAGAIDWLYRRYRQESAFVGSSLMLYEVERMLGGQLTQDAGARLRQTQVALQSVGTCDTALDPDVRQDFIVTLTPVMIASAARHRFVIPLGIQRTDRPQSPIARPWGFADGPRRSGFLAASGTRSPRECGVVRHWRSSRVSV